ncbi:MAG: hypothetical protein L0Z62_04680 [Gemmataceae bacterium]|nr:hypothetical protein [Gemmataceae bacterium]
MARMTREFSLVLLGAGVLTAGSFFWPREDLEAAAAEQANQQVASSNSSGYRRTGGGFFFVYMGRMGAMSGPSAASPMKSGALRGGGFGGVAAHVGGGSGVS